MTERGERDPATSWELGRRLEEARGTLSLDKIAEKAGLTRETVRYYELGYRADNGKKVTPRPRTLRSIAEAVGMSVREAFELGGVDPKHLLPHERQQPDPHAGLIAKMRHLDPEATHALEVLVDRILRSGGFIAPDAPGPGDTPDTDPATAVTFPAREELSRGRLVSSRPAIGTPPVREPSPDPDHQRG